ncbi:hypothetical protein Pst134EA_027949 [Puccinia striiformis f. sp. tritici]|uniref:hypothetical protein n=2 Tax=Puccinia striiformis f. sp. tritici TaxID=168172 RepID=UPI0020089EBF|nr:hypothetical protein Pst134EA_027949 [Puccinia striiformis f. sp. tritici]KAH9448652.1 hypothetical protein Pst134EA_027949 [Puccinia striiformis f. sp. tritici]
MGFSYTYYTHVNTVHAWSKRFGRMSLHCHRSPLAGAAYQSLKLTRVTAVTLPSTSNRIWRHVKTQWDHQFIKRGNFLPWLRAQLHIDPIDETSSAPEPLLCYVKRRLALAQSQQRLREAATHGQPAPTPAPQASIAPVTPSGVSDTSGTLPEPTQASSLGTQDSCSDNTSRPGSFVSPQSNGPPMGSAASQSYDHCALTVSRVPANQLLGQTQVSPSTISFSHQPPTGTATSNAFSSQLGAIADAHMGNSSHVPPTSLSSISNCPANDFHYNSNGQAAPRSYLQADTQPHQFHQSQVPFTRRAAAERSQQQLSQLSLFPSSLASSSYVTPAQPTTTSRTPVIEKAPTTKRAPRTASASKQATSEGTIPNMLANNSPPSKEANNKEANHKEVNNKADTSTSTNPISSPPADQYNRKAWKSRLVSVRTELDHISRSPARSASRLVKILSMYSITPTPNSGDWSTVPPEGRIEVLSVMKLAAPQDFYSTWAIEKQGLDMLEAWLKGSVHAHEKAKPKDASGGTATDEEAIQRETILTDLLQTVAKLPLTVENLKSHTFAKQVIRITKDQNANKFSDAVKRLADGLEKKWRAAVRVATAPMHRNGSTDSVNNPAASASDTKKRAEAGSDSNQMKKRKVETTRISITATAPAGKSTNDLFGRPDKAKLPAFAKKAVVPTLAPPIAVQDTFAQAMGLLKGKNPAGPSSQSTPSAFNTSSIAGGKLAKRVRFVADNELCQIKIVERLVYEGEEYETHPLGDARKMDAVEGRYLHQLDSFLEEEIEWQTPSEITLTSETITNLATSPLVSAELAAQDEREKAVAEVTYEDGTQIPDTPHEPHDTEPSTVGDIGSAGLPKIMKLGGNLLLEPEVSHLIAKAQADNSVDAPVAPDHTVSDLLARLGGGSGDALSELSNQTPRATMPFTSGFNTSLPPGLDMNLLNSISQSGSLQALLAASGNIKMPSQPILTTHVADPFSSAVRDNGWGAAAGSASRGREQMDEPAPYIPTGPSAGVSRNKRRKKAKDGNQPRMSAHDSFGRHIKCKWYPNCPHGNKCFYKHG